jgi:hypothetical protein
MIHLVPSKQNYNARQVAKLVFSEVYRLHGLPRTIVSNWDSLFTSTFWKRLNDLMGIKLKMSSAYHPESDGSTEWANHTITQMLRMCVSTMQRDWVTKLPSIKFALNAARSEVTGYAPFFLNYGRIPSTFVWNSPTKDKFPGVHALAIKLKNAVIDAHNSIIAHWVKETRAANRRRIPSPFRSGDLVYISTRNISFPKGLAQKLVPKFVGPYPVKEEYGTSSYKVKLPPKLRQRGVHNVFHMSLLMIHVPNNDRLFPGRNKSQVWNFNDNDQEWAVERVLSHARSGMQSLFEVEWKSGDITWMPYHQIADLMALNHYFTLIGVTTISTLKRQEAECASGGPSGATRGNILGTPQRSLYQRELLHN